MFYSIVKFTGVVILFAMAVNAVHLSIQEMYYTRGLLMNPALTVPQRESLQNLLYVTHDSWAIKKAVEFKKLHYYKCRDISTEELVLNSRVGLLKSSKNYKGYIPFHRFSEMYIQSELLRLLSTRLAATSSIPMRDRMKSNKMRTKQNITRSVEKVGRLFQAKSEIPTPAEKEKTNDFYTSVWQFVDTLDAFTKRIIWLKYDYEFNIKYTNKQIAYLMCCSEETVRKSIIRFSDEMRQEVLGIYTSV